MNFSNETKKKNEKNTQTYDYNNMQIEPYYFYNKIQISQSIRFIFYTYMLINYKF
jgi:hypothetical protein